jgi:hypothetical protein
MSIKASHIALLLSFTLQTGYASTLTGFVADVHQQPVDFFNAALLSAKDSSLVSGDSFAAGRFTIPDVTPQKYQLKISAVGYKEYTAFIEITTESLTLETVILESEIKELEEIVVNSQLPVIQNRADRTIVTVQNSFLSTTMDGFDMLRNTPGLLFGIGGLSIPGKGNPIYYVNEKRVRNMNEIQMLNPQKVKNIEIITNPPSLYDAEGHAVILINTIKENESSLRFGTTYKQAAYPSGNGYIDGTFHKNRITLNAYYLYNYRKTRLYEDNCSTLSPADLPETHKYLISQGQEHAGRFVADVNLSRNHHLNLDVSGRYEFNASRAEQKALFSNEGNQNFTS